MPAVLSVSQSSFVLACLSDELARESLLLPVCPREEDVQEGRSLFSRNTTPSFTKPAISGCSFNVLPDQLNGKQVQIPALCKDG